MYFTSVFRLSCRCSSIKSVRHFTQNSNFSRGLQSVFTNNSSKINNFPSSVLQKQLKLACSVIRPPACPASSLHTVNKRVPRKKVVDNEEKLNQNCNVLAFTTAAEYDMIKLRDALMKNSTYIPTDVDDFHRSNLVCTEVGALDTENDRDLRQIYYFQEGAVVFWNVPEEECKQILKFVKPYERSSYDPDIILSEQEVMPYTYAREGQMSDLINGQIVIASNRGNVAAALDRYTFSNAMVLSVKLGVWESLLEHYIASIEFLTDDLKHGSKIKMTREAVLKKTGELFALRHAINLSSDILDVPDFYWDREELENLYLKTSNYFSISRRTKVVNAKINHCLELLDLVSTNLNDDHHVRLEWMIIILIMVEVVLGFLHLIVGLM